MPSKDEDATKAQLAEVLSNGLAKIFEAYDSDNSNTDADTERDLDPDFVANYEELAERNSALAAALGACDCWGEQDFCDVCHGNGRPGWMLPDRRLFSYFVRPAINVLSRLRVPIHGPAQVQRHTSNGATQARRYVKGEQR